MDVIVNEHFANYHHKIQKTRSNYFKLKKRNTNFQQAKIGKQKCSKIVVVSCMVFMVFFKTQVCGAVCCSI